MLQHWTWWSEGFGLSIKNKGLSQDLGDGVDDGQLLTEMPILPRTISQPDRPRSTASGIHQGGPSIALRSIRDWTNPVLETLLNNCSPSLSFLRESHLIVTMTVSSTARLAFH
jgi:hypothetical protein